MIFPKFLRICALYERYDETNILKNNDKIYYVEEAKFIQLLADILKFNFRVEYPEDKETGQLLQTGNWTGLIGMVYRKECDLAIDTIGITMERNEAVNFSYPYYSADLTFLTDLPEALSKNLVLSHPFSTEVWIACIAFLITISLLLCVEDSKKGSYQNTMLATFSLLMNQTCSFKAKPRSTKLILFSWMIGSMFLTYSYKATYLSFLSFAPKEGVHNIVELSKAVIKGSHICKTFPGTYYIDVLLESQIPTIKVIGESLKKNSINRMAPKEFFSSLSRQKGAFIAAKPYLSPFQEIYFLSQDNFFQEMYGIAIAEKFCCKSILDESIIRMWETGIYGKFWSEKTTRELLKHTFLYIYDNDETHPLSIEDFIGAFLCLGIGYLFSVIAFATEVMLHHYFKY